MNNNGDNRASVLLVDDEDMIITSIRAFLQLETDFAINAFTDPEEAANFVKSNQIDVVVSDYLMPKMNGIQLLSRVKEAQPEASRVLLTGHADKQSAIQAINQVSLFQYLEKPWDNQQLLLVVQSGAERARLFRDLREKVGELDSAHSSLKTVQKRLIEAFL
ncbi:MAG TPA: response regulator [Candidatus Limnocylindrales bacterium]|nr:response regulator [Candidatus Limnocylindrales bacterium]